MEAIKDRMHSGSDSPLQPPALEQLGSELHTLRPAIIAAVEAHDARWERTLGGMDAAQRALTTPSALQALFYISFSTGWFRARGEDDERPPITRMIEVAVVAHDGRYWVRGSSMDDYSDIQWNEVEEGFERLDPALEATIANALSDLEEGLPAVYIQSRGAPAQRLTIPMSQTTLFMEGDTVLDEAGRLLEFTSLPEVKAEAVPEKSVSEPRHRDEGLRAAAAKALSYLEGMGESVTSAGIRTSELCNELRTALARKG